MLFISHSCEPNVGFGGSIVLVAMRDVDAGEELTPGRPLCCGGPTGATGGGLTSKSATAGTSRGTWRGRSAPS